ncbi:hypothetical protein Ct9H90mP29_09700 [bacterium]|nr:MAG: hypothetical protein Ct9H90mP29_09700 [bacterium]
MKERQLRYSVFIIAPKAGGLAMMIRFFNQVLADGGAMVGMGSFSLLIFLGQAY